MRNLNMAPLDGLLCFFAVVLALHLFSMDQLNGSITTSDRHSMQFQVRRKPSHGLHHMECFIGASLDGQFTAFQQLLLVTTTMSEGQQV